MSERSSNKQGDYKRGVWKKTAIEVPKGLGICPKCHAVFFKKSWHNPDKLPLNSGKAVFDFHVCRACDMTAKGVYEGEVLVKNVEPKYEFDLGHLIAAFGRRAMIRDNQDRIISITKTKNGFRVLTTENQLANKLAKKIKETFKTIEVTASHSISS